jgi:nucleoid-associated protein YgaU
MGTRARAAAALAGTGAAYAGSSAALAWATTGMLAQSERPGPVPLDALLGLAAAGGAWLVLSWLAATFTIAVLAAATRAGAELRRAADRVTPATARRVAAAVLGVGLAASPLGLAGPATAEGGAPATRQTAGPLPGWTADRPAPPSRSAAEPRNGPVGGSPASAATALRVVVVRPGDTLWDIAARHLGAGAAAAAVVAEWPRWYAANREVVGADPHLIRPGLGLRPPAQSPHTSPATPRSDP